MDRRAVGEAALGALEGLRPNLGARFWLRPAQVSLTAFPKRHFPAIHRCVIGDAGAIFQSQ